MSRHCRLGKSFVCSAWDWRRLKAASGSAEPKQQGCFVCQDEAEVDWFVGMNNTGGPFDGWDVSGVDRMSLVESPEGYHVLPETTPRNR